MTCDCCIPTPDSVMEDMDIDVFEQIVPDSEVYHDVMRQALWDTYEFRGLGNPDVAYWIKTMQSRFRQIQSVYHVKFQVVDEWLQSVASKVDLADSASEYTTISENEDNPDNPQGDTKYLSDRNTVTYNGKSYGGLSSETIRRFNDAIPNIKEEFADEFRRNFYHGV